MNFNIIFWQNIYSQQYLFNWFMKFKREPVNNLFDFKIIDAIKVCFFWFATIFLSQGCTDKCHDKAIEKTAANFQLVRLEKELFQAKDVNAMYSVLQRHPKFTMGYLGVQRKEDLEIVSTQLLDFYKNKTLVDFNKETQKSFQNMDSLHVALTLFFQHIKYSFPQFFVPEVNTVVTGFHFEKDLYVSDSLIVISLDYFLGKGAKFRPPYFNYFLERYDKPYLLPMLALGVSSKFNKVNMKDETMLSNMIFYGKAIYFAQAVLPCASDSLIVMYSGQQLQEVNENVSTIWSHFIEKKLLFETNRHLIDKYVGETPKINEIGEKCPGRIGQWLGWEIVKKYMKENPAVTLPQLMADDDAQKIFRLSKYKPKK